ncbi:hypothetical protein N658DRAFT_63833 [Parathielavia hyrcaniae]|uniref:Uncharacterized protein n=1 Tax=Parathielavia hyrcaniae TaxID=113614 RepID=A0AAN6Q3D3_9PEZI|nr:hypothetical protein N658DRAFT_63833 [Parathielavia hyrcaniae]
MVMAGNLIFKSSLSGQCLEQTSDFGRLAAIPLGSLPHLVGIVVSYRWLMANRFHQGDNSTESAASPTLRGEFGALSRRLDIHRANSVVKVLIIQAQLRANYRLRTLRQRTCLLPRGSIVRAKVLVTGAPALAKFLLWHTTKGWSLMPVIDRPSNLIICFTVAAYVTLLWKDNGGYRSLSPLTSACSPAHLPHTVSVLERSFSLRAPQGTSRPGMYLFLRHQLDKLIPVGRADKAQSLMPCERSQEAHRQRLELPSDTL